MVRSINVGLTTFLFCLLIYHCPVAQTGNGIEFIPKAVNGYKRSGAPLLQKTDIGSPFWETWWFYSMAAIGFFGISGTYLYLWNNLKKTQRKLIRAELASLGSQLSSHFIFNSITSLQNFIISNKNDLALDYLTKFSRLIGLILDNSKKDMITLEEEMEFLKLYCLMEKARFDRQIRFDVEADPDIDRQATLIPPMLLQPLIENSIIHGQVDQVENGSVFIRFGLKNNFLYCTVQDTGVGRELAMENNKRRALKKQGRGLRILGERLGKLSEATGKDASLTIQDLTDNIGKPNGTRIIITTPHLNNLSL